MKHLIIAGVFAIATGSASADAFEWQKRIGGPELNPYESTAGMTFAPVAKSDLVSSLTVWMQTANVDGIADNDFRGTIVDSPEGIAYSDYPERYPAETDWDAVAHEYRENREIVSTMKSQEGDS